MYITNRTKTAFSLAEVLVTMLIVLVVILASTNILSKKQSKTKNVYGMWECYINENNQHESIMSINGIKGLPQVKDPNSCSFKAPSDAENFAITVIGGGGGASATTAAQDAISMGETVMYEPTSNGEYDILLIGGGSGSSAYNPIENGTSYPSESSLNSMIGCPGQVLLTKHTLNQNKKYILRAGYGGEGGTFEVDDEGKAQIVNPQNGTESVFFEMYTNNKKTAKGGEWLKNNETTKRSATKCLASIHPKYNEGNSSGDYNYGGACTYLGEKICTNAMFGYGADATTTDTGKPGENGIVMIKSKFFFAGGGGQSGKISFKTFETIKEPITVKIGQGGPGGVEENIPGSSGTATVFGDILTAAGGKGGNIKTGGNSSNAEQTLNGGRGEASPLGSFLPINNCNLLHPLNGCNDMQDNNGIPITKQLNLYGAGGSGGGAKSRTKCPNGGVNGYSDCWGKGGRGSSGYVKIEWN